MLTNPAVPYDNCAAAFNQEKALVGVFTVILCVIFAKVRLKLYLIPAPALRSVRTPQRGLCHGANIQQHQAVIWGEYNVICCVMKSSYPEPEWLIHFRGVLHLSYRIKVVLW